MDGVEDITDRKKFATEIQSESTTDKKILKLPQILKKFYFGHTFTSIEWVTIITFVYNYNKQNPIYNFKLYEKR